MSTSEQVAIALVILFAIFVGVIFVSNKIDKTMLIAHDYQTVVEVDKSEKVEWAISNAMENVTSRNFVLTGIEITHPTLKGNKYVIKAKGRERANILRMDD